MFVLLAAVRAEPWAAAAPPGPVQGRCFSSLAVFGALGAPGACPPGGAASGPLGSPAPGSSVLGTSPDPPPPSASSTNPPAEPSPAAWFRPSRPLAKKGRFRELTRQRPPSCPGMPAAPLASLPLRLGHPQGSVLESGARGSEAGQSPGLLPGALRGFVGGHRVGPFPWAPQWAGRSCSEAADEGPAHAERQDRTLASDGASHMSLLRTRPSLPSRADVPHEGPQQAARRQGPRGTSVVKARKGQALGGGTGGENIVLLPSLERRRNTQQRPEGVGAPRARGPAAPPPRSYMQEDGVSWGRELRGGVW